MGGFAWVTLATNDSYSLGALVLAHSLKAVGTAHQLAILITPGVTSAMREKLAAVFNVVQEVNILDSRDEANLRLLKRPELGITFTKLHCWRLTQFEKCVFLDADTLVLQYCDELFEREELSAAPDVGWPDCFNSGVFVYRPSLETYEKLIQFALEKGSFDGGDQGLLNLYFSDWAHKDISKHLPFIYNMCSTACYSYLPAFKQFGANAKIIHFIGAQKPWLQYFNTENRKVQPSADSAHLQEVLQRWWDIFCSLIHPHLSPAMPQGQLQHAVSPSYFPPQYAPPPNPTSSADDYENAWDPWDEYDQKIAQIAHFTSVSTHIQNQPIQSLNTNASHVADQPTIHSQPQSHNYNTYTAQNNSFYQPSPQPVYQHVSRVPTPPPSPQPLYHHQKPSYDHSKTQYRHPEPQYHQPEPPYHHPETQSHHPESQYHHESQYQHHEELNHQSQPHFYHQKQHRQPELHTHNAELHQQHVHHHQHEHTHQSSPSHHHQPHYEHSQHIDNHQHTHHSSEQFHSQNDNSHSHETRAESFPLGPDRPRSPKLPDPVPILPKGCEATTTVSNDMSLSSTIEDCNQDNAGLAGAFAQLTLGVPRTEEQDALENLLRKQAWEVGNIDYLGRDSFDNIWSKISETLGATTLQPLAPEQEPLAPVQSQTESAPEEEAKPAEPTVTPIATPSDTATATDNLKIDSVESSSSETPKDQLEIIQPAESSISSTPKETAEPEKLKPQDEAKLVSSTVPEEIKEGESTQSQPLSEVSSTPAEQESVAEKAEDKVVETKASEPQTEEPKLETAAPETQTVVLTTETKITEPQTDVSAKETKAPEPQIAAAEACPIPQKKDLQAKASEVEPTKETEAVPEPVCPLPKKKETLKESGAQVTPSQPEQKVVEAPTSEAPKETSSDQQVPKETPPSQEEPKVTPQLQETSEKTAVTAPKEPQTLAQPTEVPTQLETLPEKSEVSAPPAESLVTPAASKTTASTKVLKPKKAAVAAESAAAPADSKPAPLKDSPKTKVTEATPPATPGSPLVEKTKEALAAEANIPDTPPPSEGGSTPAPPPRKTDKPKKVAAKPKK